jgi:hypothetical protein
MMPHPSIGRAGAGELPTAFRKMTRCHSEEPFASLKIEPGQA